MRFTVINFGENKDYFVVVMTDLRECDFNRVMRSDLKDLLNSWDGESESINNDIVDLFKSKGYRCAILDNVDLIDMTE